MSYNTTAGVKLAGWEVDAFGGMFRPMAIRHDGAHANLEFIDTDLYVEHESYDGMNTTCVVPAAVLEAFLRACGWTIERPQVSPGSR